MLLFSIFTIYQTETGPFLEDCLLLFSLMLKIHTPTKQPTNQPAPLEPNQLQALDLIPRRNKRHLLMKAKNFRKGTRISASSSKAFRRLVGGSSPTPLKNMRPSKLGSSSPRFGVKITKNIRVATTYKSFGIMAVE